MYDPTAAYRSTQVTSSSPAARIVLLYQGAIRFASQHLAALERGDLEVAHNASIRCQAIVAALQETLDLSAGPIAVQLDQLYEFILRRLAEGNVTKRPQPTEEVRGLLRDLLDAWQQVAGAQRGGSATPTASPVESPAVPAPAATSQRVLVGGAR